MHKVAGASTLLRQKLGQSIQEMEALLGLRASQDEQRQRRSVRIVIRTESE